MISRQTSKILPKRAKRGGCWVICSPTPSCEPGGPASGFRVQTDARFTCCSCPFAVGSPPKKKPKRHKRRKSRPKKKKSMSPLELLREAPRSTETRKLSAEQDQVLRYSVHSEGASSKSTNWWALAIASKQATIVTVSPLSLCLPLCLVQYPKKRYPYFSA